MLDIQQRRTELSAAFHSLVSSELHVIDGEPPQEYLQQTEQIISHCLARAQEHVRAGADDVSAAKRGTAGQADRFDGLRTMANGTLSDSDCCLIIRY